MVFLEFSLFWGQFSLIAWLVDCYDLPLMCQSNPSKFKLAWYAIAIMTCFLTCQFQFKNGCSDDCRWLIALRNQIVNINRFAAKPWNDDLAAFWNVCVGKSCLCHFNPYCFFRGNFNGTMLDNRLDDISRIMHKGGTIADKLVATILSWIKWRSGNGHHLIAAFTRFTRGDQ